ncbi:MAG: hypothetical protein KDJ80_04230 [Nitratireductor sp.]|nr:hypothetical protein [Nitratireductor sp.]
MAFATGRKAASLAAGLLMAGGLLSGCVGGTTYGTGVTQEQQTIEDIANILTIQKKQKRIDYKPRPDLVVPEEKQLVDPDQVASAQDNADWPESPEERIARVRAEAEEAQSTSAGQNRFSRSQKNVRGVEPGTATARVEAPRGQGVPGVSCDPDGNYLRHCTPGEISRAVRAQRDEIRSVGKTGYQRRYLTEPPIAYRTPANSAPTDDLGYTEKELAEIEALRKKKEQEELYR